MELSLMVLKTPDLQKTADFYTLFGLYFDYHRHGNGPFHYSAQVGPTVLEIYPLLKSQTEADKNLRLGFSVDDFDAVVRNLKSREIVFLSEPAAGEFGYRAVVQDPDGRKIELYAKSKPA